MEQKEKISNNGDAALPSAMSPEAKERELSEAVSSLRQERNAELAKLREKKVANALHKQLISDDGKIIFSTNVNTREREERLHDLAESVATRQPAVNRGLEASDQLLSQSVSILRQGRDAELAKLKENKVARAQQQKLVSEGGEKRDPIARPSLRRCDSCRKHVSQGLVQRRAEAKIENEAKERELEEAVTSLRQVRSAELAELKEKKVTVALQKQLVSEDGRMMSSPVASIRKQEALAQQAERLNELARSVEGKESVVSRQAMLDEAAAKGGEGVVLDLNDFFLRQKEKHTGDLQKKGKAAELLHSYRGLMPESEDCSSRNRPATKSSTLIPPTNSSYRRSDSWKYVGRGLVQRRAEEKFEHEAKEREEEAVSNLRQGRSSELAELREKRVTVALQKQLVSEDGRMMSPIASTRTQEAFAQQAERLNELARSVEGKESVEARQAMLDEAAANGGDDVVRDLNDFFVRQREKHAGDLEKKGKAADMLHKYRSLVPASVGSSSQKRPESPSFVEESLHAADRAAAVAYFKAERQKQTQILTSDNGAVQVDLKNADYRSFVFVVHETHGMLLLHCTQKKGKGPHFQLPGGHVDDHEFLWAARAGGDPLAQLLTAAKLGAARELFEETGIDVRMAMERLQPAALRSRVEEPNNTTPELNCELKKRLYFLLPVSDADFPAKEKIDDAADSKVILVSPLGTEGSHLTLKLSAEHSGFTFEKDPKEAAKLLTKHSGGVGAEALLMAMNRDDEQDQTIGTDTTDTEMQVMPTNNSDDTQGAGDTQCCKEATDTIEDSPPNRTVSENREDQSALDVPVQDDGKQLDKKAKDAGGTENLVVPTNVDMKCDKRLDTGSPNSVAAEMRVMPTNTDGTQDRDAPRNVEATNTTKEEQNPPNGTVSENRGVGATQPIVPVLLLEKSKMKGSIFSCFNCWGREQG